MAAHKTQRRRGPSRRTQTHDTPGVNLQCVPCCGLSKETLSVRDANNSSYVLVPDQSFNLRDKASPYAHIVRQTRPRLHDQLMHASHHVYRDSGIAISNSLASGMGVRMHASPSTSKDIATYSPSSHSTRVSSPTTIKSPARLRQNPSYVHASTQYSPDGYPPTASHSVRMHGHKRRLSTIERAEDTSVPAAHDSNQSSHNAATSEAIAAVTSHDPSPVIPAPSPVPATTVAAVSKRSKSTSNPKPMPEKYETCDPKDLGFLIANMLMELIRLNDDIPLRDGKLTRFHSRAPPGISCHDYLLRLIQHATLSPPILLSMVFYIDRLCALYSSFTISSLTVHRFLITAATVASKGLSDSFWTNVTYARIGGISTSELATLELDFLQRVQFRIVPKPETLVDYYKSLVLRSPGYVLESAQTVGQPLQQEDAEMS